MSACVPTTIWASPEAISCRAAACSFARSELVSSVTRTPSGAHSSSMVRKCCSASVSVGAMSAPWRPTSTARRRACSATTVLPEPTSPWRSRCIGTARSRSRVDLGHRAFLIGRERERKRVAIARDELPRLAERLRRGALARGGRPRERESEDEELVEREPHASDLRLGERARTMDGDERIRPHRQALGREHRGGQILSDVADTLRAPARAGRGASSASRPRRPGRRVRSRAVSASPSRSYEETANPCLFARPRMRIACAGDELRLEPRLVEPGRLDLPRLVRDPCGEDLEPTAAATRRRANDALENSLLVAEEITDPLRRHRLLVASRSLPEKISDRRQAESRETAGDSRADPVERLDRCARGLRASARSAGEARSQARRGRRTRPAAPCERSSQSQPRITIGLALSGALEELRRGREASAFRDRRYRDPRSRIPDLRD